MGWSGPVLGSSRLCASAVILGCALAFLAARDAWGAFKYLKTGSEAPDFTLKTLDGRDIPLAALREKPATLIVFWATWSPRSEAVLREAKALHERLSPKGLRAVAVNIDRADLGLRERALVEKTIQDLGLGDLVALDPGLAASQSFGIVATPSIALLDAKGVLVFDASGWSKSLEAATREQVEILLGLRKAAPADTGKKKYAPTRKALLNYNLARTFLQQGNTGKAASLLESAADADAAWAPPRTLLGHLDLRERTEASLKRAEQMFRAAVALEPDDVSAVAGLGEALLRQGKVEEAEAKFKKALEMDPNFTPAVEGHAVALARQGKAAEAWPLFDAALALNPRDAGVFASRGECREIAGDLPGAAQDLRTAVEILLGKR